MSQPVKTALVTGAARGIGLATAKRFLAEGWRVALLDIDGENLQRTFKALAKPETTLAITCDVADRDGVARAIDTVAKTFGRLDALVNNAGIAIFKPILEVTYEDWSRVLAVNLTGPFLCTQAAAPLLRDSGGGAVVNITSISGLRASTLRTAYGTSKAGLAHLTKQQAAELAVARHPRQRGGARPGRYRHGESRAHAGNSPGLSRPHAAQPLRPGRGTGGGDLLSVQRPVELHHRTGDCRRRRLRFHRHRPADVCATGEVVSGAAQH